MQQQFLRPSRRASAGSLLQLKSLPPALRPLVRAYLLGYTSAVAPRLLTLLVRRLSQRATTGAKSHSDGRPRRTFVESALAILRTGCEPQRFPTFCALLVGGFTLLQVRTPTFSQESVLFSLLCDGRPLHLVPLALVATFTCITPVCMSAFA